MNKAYIKALASSFDDKEHTLSCVMSAEVMDRHGEIVDIETMALENYMMNPVVLQSHDYDELAVGKVLSIVKRVNEAGIKVMECVMKFAVDEYDVAKTHWELYKGGYMSAFSIGFRVGGVQQDAPQPCGLSTCTGMGDCPDCVCPCTRLINCELLEISCVSVPANQLALAKSKGLDISKFMETVPTKAKRDMLIELKESLGLKDLKEATTTEPVVAQKKTPAILNKEQRAKLMLDKAIRALK